VCSDRGMRIVLDIEEEDIERIARSLDNQYAYTLGRNLEDSGYKRLAELFRGFLKRGPGQAESPSKDQPTNAALKKPPASAKSQKVKKPRSA
jgi:hypothetical protein